MRDRLVGEGKPDNQLADAFLARRADRACGRRRSCSPPPTPARLGADRVSGWDGAELLHQGDAVELRPDVGHATVLEAVEVHALDPDRLAGGGDPHELLLLRTGHDPPGGDGVAAGDNVLQVLLQVGEDRLEARDLLLEAGQRRLFVGRWIVVDQARVAELVDRRLVGRAKRVLEARDDLDVVGLEVLVLGGDGHDRVLSWWAGRPGPIWTLEVRASLYNKTLVQGSKEQVPTRWLGRRERHVRRIVTSARG